MSSQRAFFFIIRPFLSTGIWQEKSFDFILPLASGRFFTFFFLFLTKYKYTYFMITICTRMGTVPFRQWDFQANDPWDLRLISLCFRDLKVVSLGHGWLSSQICEPRLEKKKRKKNLFCFKVFCNDENFG